MNKKVLLVATVDQHIKHFHLPLISRLANMGYEVHVASNGRTDFANVAVKHNIPFERNPLKRNNIKSYRKLKKIINMYKYETIHVHTPVGALLGRLAARHVRTKGSKVVYTAHGFHFFEGASLKNWILYYPVEKFLSRYTDTLITINNEDYQTAIRKKFKAKEIKLIPGVGIDIDSILIQNDQNKLEARKKYGYKDEDLILFYAAELNENKNQALLIRAINLLREKMPNIKLVLAGDGDHAEIYREIVQRLGVNQYVNFLGYRHDVKEILPMVDIAVASSKREGLPVNIIEAMAVGLPIVSSNVRGHRDLVQDGVNGYLFTSNKIEELILKVELLCKNEELNNEMKLNSRKLSKEYSQDKILARIIEVYK